ncbi:hypothetical protein V2S66_33600 [Streptomyces sp. V4-01]|uniref:Uncharacterized protein n=1 Tax=Actinacidiphila polyblastidii TaxID=3110430 RepID=A0ABU7PM26_9ACTN|nr:hypothetical protein [Streptomyces sp. V4-01]
MNLNASRRLAALSAAVLCAATLSTLAGAASAAATGEPVVTVDQPAVVAAATAAATGAAATVQPQLAVHTDATSPVIALVLTIDVRSLAKIADVTFSDNCTVAKSVATCEEYLVLQDQPPGSAISLSTQLSITARSGVAPGAAASYKVTGTAGDGASVVGTSGRVQIGGPAFDLAPGTDRSHLAVGTVVDEPVRFADTGDRPAAGVRVLVTASPGLAFARHYTNCSYSSLPDTRQAEMALCDFPGTFEVGEQAELATPVELRVTPAAYSTLVETLVAPKGDPELAQLTAGRTWKQGKGGTLALTVLDPGRPGTAPAGRIPLAHAEDGGHGSDQLTVLQADNTADFSVTGATAQAPQGTTVPLDFSLTDNGPATLFLLDGGTIHAEVVVPPGTTVVGSSPNCQPDADDPDTTAHGPYRCSAGYLAPAGRTVPFSLTLRVDTVIAGAQGSVAMDWGPYPHTFDPDPADDTALLTLN